jgi:hypothetical protein
VVQLPVEHGEATTRYMNSLPTRLHKPQLPRASSGSSSNDAHHAAASQNLSVAEHLKNEKIRAIKLLIAFAFATKVSSCLQDTVNTRSQPFEFSITYEGN